MNTSIEVFVGETFIIEWSCELSMIPRVGDTVTIPSIDGFDGTIVLDSDKCLIDEAQVTKVTWEFKDAGAPTSVSLICLAKPMKMPADHLT